MRIKTLLFILLVGMFSFMLSCVSTPPELTAEHEHLIGTKWLAIGTVADTMEFVDRYTFVLTSNGKESRIRYTVKENKIIVGNNVLIFERRGEELYCVGLLSYRKV